MPSCGACGHPCPIHTQLNSSSTHARPQGKLREISFLPSNSTSHVTGIDAQKAPQELRRNPARPPIPIANLCGSHREIPRRPSTHPLQRREPQIDVCPAAKTHAPPSSGPCRTNFRPRRASGNRWRLPAHRRRPLNSMRRRHLRTFCNKKLPYSDISRRLALCESRWESPVRSNHRVHTRAVF